MAARVGHLDLVPRPGRLHERYNLEGPDLKALVLGLRVMLQSPKP